MVFSVPMAASAASQKNTNSAFIGTDLEVLLKKQSIQHIVVVGLTTDHCVSATVRNAADLGFEVTLVADATATYAKTGLDGTLFEAELVHQINMASLKDEFATIVDTEKLLSDLKNSSSDQ